MSLNAPEVFLAIASGAAAALTHLFTTVLRVRRTLAGGPRFARAAAPVAIVLPAALLAANAARGFAPLLLALMIFVIVQRTILSRTQNSP